jgi:hypothetical protein
MVESKEVYLEKLQAKLAEWKAKLTELKEKATKSPAETKAEIETEVGVLEAQLREIEGPIQQMLQSGETTPEKFQEVVQPVEAKLDEAFQSVTIKFS